MSATDWWSAYPPPPPCPSASISESIALRCVGPKYIEDEFPLLVGMPRAPPLKEKGRIAFGSDDDRDEVSCPESISAFTSPPASSDFVSPEFIMSEFISSERISSESVSPNSPAPLSVISAASSASSSLWRSSLTSSPISW